MSRIFSFHHTPFYKIKNRVAPSPQPWKICFFHIMCRLHTSPGLLCMPCCPAVYTCRRDGRWPRPGTVACSGPRRAGEELQGLAGIREAWNLRGQLGRMGFQGPAPGRRAAHRLAGKLQRPQGPFLIKLWLSWLQAPLGGWPPLSSNTEEQAVVLSCALCIM